MAAASSGDPGGTNRRRVPQYMDPTNKFGELTFLQLTGKDGATLPKNPFIIGKSVEVTVCGPIEGAKSEAQGTQYTLKIRDPTQVSKLLTMKKLIDGTEVVVKAHPNLNVSRCVISCYDLIHMDENDIQTELHSLGVTRVQRITRKEGEKRVNTPALIITFCKTTYPDNIKIGLLYVPTRPYFPNPMLCYGCFSYGHTRLRCPGPQRCYNCSSENHGEECTAKQFCRNCKGEHRPTSRQCPVYKLEMEVIKIKVRDNVTFPEARKRAEQLNKGSYAQATSQQSVIEKKLKELEESMGQKDEQITKLLELSKQKDDRMEKMMSYIHKLKEKIVDLESSLQNKELRQTQQPTGPNTRSRNNSPAVQETKRGRPTKQNQVNPTRQGTSPDERSPPPKKTATTTTILPTNMDYSDEDEVESIETPPNQRLR